MQQALSLKARNLAKDFTFKRGWGGNSTTAHIRGRDLCPPGPHALGKWQRNQHRAFPFCHLRNWEYPMGMRLIWWLTTVTEIFQNLLHFHFLEVENSNYQEMQPQLSGFSIDKACPKSGKLEKHKCNRLGIKFILYYIIFNWVYFFVWITDIITVSFAINLYFL